MDFYRVKNSKKLTGIPTSDSQNFHKDKDTETLLLIKNLIRSHFNNKNIMKKNIKRRRKPYTRNKKRCLKTAKKNSFKKNEQKYK